MRARGQDEAPKVDPPPRPAATPDAPPPSGGRTRPPRSRSTGGWPGVRRFLFGTLTIWRTGGGVRLVFADLRAGIRWAVHR